MDLVQKAYIFAEHHHALQERKYTGEAYIVHPVAVHNLVSTVTPNLYILAAALLHDVVEDCDVTPQEVWREFGPVVGKLVIGMTQVSKPEDGNRAIRKTKDLEYLRLQSGDVQTIKYADMIDNAKSIVEYDRGFAKTFMKEMKTLLEALTLGSSVLYSEALEIVDMYYEGEAG